MVPLNYAQNALTYSNKASGERVAVGPVWIPASTTATLTCIAFECEGIKKMAQSLEFSVPTYNLRITPLGSIPANRKKFSVRSYIYGA